MATQIFSFESGPVATFGYILADMTIRHALIVDVPLESAQDMLAVLDEQGLSVQAILLTHSHWDHTGNAQELKRATNAPIYCHPADAYRLVEPMKYTMFRLPFVIEQSPLDHELHHGDTISCGMWNLEVRHTPGHTEGGVCLIDHLQNIAFVGDTLFAGSIGRTDLPGGNTQQLLASIHRELMPLPDSMEFFAGHGDASTIGYERVHNRFLY
jgi:hydroxyacylglutathione hydrolase